MKNRVLIDSCVLLSASIHVSSSDIDEKNPLKHQFYEECRELFTYIEANLSKRIGIITVTVENEAVGVLDKVIEGELKRIGHHRSEDFELFSRVFNICDIKMRGLIALLQREPVNSVDVAMKFIVVKAMYDEFSASAKKLPKLAAAQKHFVAKRFRGAVDWWQIFKNQDQTTHSQLYNLLRKEAEFSDMTILAEAFHLKLVYEATEGKGGHLYLASKDKHFVPVRKQGWIYEGRELTDEIYKRFGVTCEHPKKVKELFMASRALKKA